MRHLKSLTVAKADAIEKQDEAGWIFFQIWLTVLSAILGKGLSGS